MKNTLFLLSAIACSAVFSRAQDLPREWVDPDTGHRIVQLSKERGEESLYFTQYPFTAGGTKMVMIAPQGNIDLVTLATGEIEHVYTDHGARILHTGRKTGAIFYTKGGALYSLDPATKESRMLVKVPEHGDIVAVNCDETLAVGTITEGGGERRGRGKAAPAQPVILPGGIQQGDIPSQVAKHEMMDRRLAEHIPTTLYVINLQTGEIRNLVHGTDWIDHEQFSPTDPTLLIYAHEGRQWKIDRVWMIRTDGQSQPMLVHQRTMKMEIAVHEYWSNDGQWIWYDLQTPLSEDFWVAGYNVTNGKRLWYHLPPNHWSVHYNTSPDGTLFSGDGSDPVIHYAKAQDAKWIFLFHPSLIPDMPDETPDQEHMIQAGKFTAERLVNFSKHDYSLEPNGIFTPDGKWIVFRSNFRGPIGVYAVEVAKAQ
ncbi:MAG: oligogalacturonate lyase family protein [Opitutaceae bacterium]